MQLANRLGYFPEYIFSRLAKTVKEVEAKSGRKVLNFGIGSPDFPPSKIYLNKLAQFYQDPNAHIYPGYGAIPEFTSAVINWYQKRFQVNLAENELFPLLGSKEGIAYLVLALTNPGDEILVPDPGYPSFAATALMFKVKPVYYNLTKANNFKPVLKELEKLVNKKTKLIWVNFPSNPTGQVINLKELGMIAEFAYKHRIYLAYDNTYAEITFGKYITSSILQIKRVKDFVIELQSLSKTFSFAGFRIGWLAGSSQIVAAIAKIKSQFDSGLSQPLQKLACDVSQLTIFQNRDDARQFIAAGVVAEGKAIVIPGSGVPTDMFSPGRVSSAMRENLRNELDLKPGETVVTMISRVIRAKGIPEFMAAAQEISARRPDVRFLLVGPEDTESIDRLNANELAQLKQAVTWPGPRRDVPTVLALSDIFVLPSAYREGIPRVLLEAAAMGLPIVTTNSPGCSEVVEDGVNGYLVPVRDAPALSQAILRLLEQRELRQRFGQASRQRVVERFDLSVIVKQMRSVYYQLLAEQAPLLGQFSV